MDYKIRKAKIEDLDAIYRLVYERCLWFSKKGFKGWEKSSYLNNYGKSYFSEQMKINKLFVLKLNNEICGSMLLKDKDEDYWGNDDSSYYIHHLVTDVNSRGIGKILLSYAIEQCKINNKKYLKLDCYQESKFLNEYYSKLGFNYAGSGTKKDYNYNLWEIPIPVKNKQTNLKNIS